MACLPPLVTRTCGGGHLEPRVAAGLGGHRLPQLGEPAGRRVLVGPRVAAGHLGRGHDVLGGGEVGLPGAEADDVLARRPGAPWPWRRRPGWPTGRPRRSGPRSVGRSSCRRARRPLRAGPVSVGMSHGAMIPYVTDTPDISIPAHLLPGRRAVRLRAVEGAPRGRRGAGRRGRSLPRHQPPPEDGQVGGGQPAGRALPSCSRCPTATRWCSATGGPPASGTPPPSASSSARAST